ncbi:MAG: glycosyltransferase family 2 protein [Cyanobacterium sp.]
MATSKKILLDSICIFSTVKASLEETSSFIEYHLKMGIDFLIIFFDDPQDEAIAKFAENKKIICIPCTNEYWNQHAKKEKLSVEERQETNATVALSIARSKNIDWIIHIDVDEYIYVYGKSVKEILSKTSQRNQVVRFSAVEAVPYNLNHINPIQEINLFKVHPLTRLGKNFKINPWTYFRLLLQKIIYRLKFKFANIFCKSLKNRSYIRGYIIGKSAARLNSSITGFKCHFPTSTKNTLLNYTIAYDIVILHFNCSSFDVWKKKWKRRMENPLSIKRLNNIQKKELKQFEEGFLLPNDDQQLKAIYENLYFLSSREQSILTKLKLLVNINIFQ